MYHYLTEEYSDQRSKYRLTDPNYNKKIQPFITSSHQKSAHQASSLIQGCLSSWTGLIGIFHKNLKKEFSKRYLTEASRQEILKMISNSMERVAEKVCSRTFISPETNADRVLQIQRILDVVQVTRISSEFQPRNSTYEISQIE